MDFSLRTTTLAAAAAACLTLMPGCDRRTPEERLQTAMEFYQQGDTLSAEMEALKVVEKAPDDPASVQASMLLAQIYAAQQDYEQAEVQVKSALENVSQLEPEGKDLLRFYLSLLSSQGKHEEALKVVDEYQQEYAGDEGTSLSLTVAKADIRTQTGETTAAREILNELIDRTTDSTERGLYRDMYLRTYMAEENTTGAIEYLQQHMDTFDDINEKQAALIGLASLHGANENYEESRSYLEQATESLMETIRHEIDRRAKLGLSLQLGQAYLSLGNLPGARRVFQTVYESGSSDPQAVVPAVNGLTETLMRLGETSATQQLLQDAAAKHPEAPFKDQLQRLEEIIAKGELETVAPVDTSTLTMRYKEEQNVLWPADLPAVLGGDTTGTATGAAETTGTATGAATVDTQTTGAEEMNTPVAEETPQVTSTPAPEETTGTAEAVEVVIPAPDLTTTTEQTTAEPTVAPDMTTGTEEAAEAATPAPEAIPRPEPDAEEPAAAPAEPTTADDAEGTTAAQ